MEQTRSKHGANINQRYRKARAMEACLHCQSRDNVLLARAKPLINVIEKREQWELAYIAEPR
jgi:hypothetical protein